MSLTAKDVAEIMRMLEESSFDSLTLEMNGIKLNLRRNSPARRNDDIWASSTMTPTSAMAGPIQKKKIKPASETGLSDVPSPMLGIFYRAPKPGEPPFIEIGSNVEEDTVIGIIEVMKLMNSVRAGVKGEVVEVLAENGAPVEYGEILVRVRLGS
jgi:acetyl-CoA carboxylase biotin carboxyl carrier protein